MERFSLLIACITILAGYNAHTSAQDLARRYEINIGDFNKLQVSDDLNVTYRCNADSAGLAVFTATADEMQSIIFNNKNSSLKIQMSTDRAIADSTLPLITVYSAAIKELENNSDSTLTIENISSASKIKMRLTDNGQIIARNITAPEIEAKLFTGKGLIEISGKCDKARLRCTGTGKIDAFALDATDVDCRIVGTGSINCRIDGGTLLTRGSGPGRVYFKGTPAEIKSRHIGRLKTIPVKDEEESNIKP